MSRPIRIQFPGALYHITSRGNGRKNIFRDDADRGKFLEALSSTIGRYHWLCHAYCLMNNHYHLLIETPEANLSAGMRQLNGVYTQKYNYFHSTVGHVFQGRYKSFVIEKEPYLLEVARYIVQNPVRAKIVSSPEEWEWSSYRATCGKRKPPSWLTTDWILHFFKNKKQSAKKQYQKFVCEGNVTKSPFVDIEEGIILGFPQFVDWVRDTQKDREKINEIPREERFVGRLSLKDLFSERMLKNKQMRDDMIRIAHLRVGYSQKDIADHVGLHYTWVSKIINEKKGQTLKPKT
jgi:REP element-mobilizing transposase RayT